MTPKSIISIQSHVAYGHVGNASAVFPLQRMGFEVWPVMTVQFSNHTGYGKWTGQVFSPEHIAEITAGMQERGGFDNCAGALSGYMGSANLGGAIVEAAAEVKRRNPGALYACDPVMGDVGRGVFVQPEIPDFMRDHAVPAADVITPNQFELELLTGVEVKTLDDALRGARIALDRGPSIVLVTSLLHSATPEDTIEMLAVTNDGGWVTSTPMLDLDPAPNGAGDVVSAIFLGRLLQGESVEAALGKTATAIYGVFQATHKAGVRELQLIAAQECFADPQSASVQRVA